MTMVKTGRLVVIHGLKFAGKSRVAERLMEGHGFVRVKMADPLKNMIRSLLRDAGIDVETIERCVEGDLKEVPLDVLCGHTTRHAMMMLGNEWRDLLDSELWVQIAAAKIRSLLSQGIDVVVDDIRYPKELAILAQFLPAKWVVTRGDLHFQPYGEDRHPSERPMDVALFDAHLDNGFPTFSPLFSLVDETLERAVFPERLAA
jgi:chloramphenicol 3-O-phosphotransferase